jgi:hypothetical protein
MSGENRVELYNAIEAHRKRPLIVYVTSKRAGLNAAMSTDALPCLIEQIDALPPDTKAIDFLIASYGGDPMVAWRISSLLRQRVEDVAVLIPQSAYSAATLVALGANEIIMHPNSHLGPVDMQMQLPQGDGGQAKRFSTEDISAFLDFVRDNLKITDQEHVRALFEITCNEVGSLGIGLTARSSKLAVDLGESLLALHMKDDENRSKLRGIVENMSRKFQSHAYPVNRKEALELGLAVNKKQDVELEKLMWDIWLNIEEDLKERVPFDPICELLNSKESGKLLAPVPQMNIPMCATATPSYQNTIDQIVANAKTTIDPVDFELTYAMVESCRAVYRYVTRGKYLACRMPDMMIRYNMLIMSRIWERAALPKLAKGGKTS